MKTKVFVAGLLLVLFAFASAASAQNKVGLFLGAGNVTGGNYKGDYGNTPLTPSGSVAPSVGVQSSPMSIFSVGADYLRFRAKGSKSRVAMAKLDGTPLITTTSSVDTMNNVVLGNVSVGFGNKNIWVGGSGTGGVGLVKENHSLTAVANDPKYTEDAARTQAMNPPGSKNYTVAVYGGGPVVRVRKGHFGAEVKPEYLIPFGFVIMYRVGFFF